jgi:DNA polymerase-4
VTLTLRWNDFTTITRAITFSHHTDDTLHLYRIALGLWSAAIRGVRKKVRLLGVSVSHLRKKAVDPQLGLFDVSSCRRNKNTDEVIDRLRDKYGESVILRAYSTWGNDQRFPNPRLRRRAQDTSGK